MKENKLYKRLIIVAIAAIMLLVVANTASAAHIQIGTGTSSAYYTPFRAYYDYSWSGMIILAEEIGGPMDINAMSFDNKGTPTFPFTQYNQIFYMKHIPNTFDQWPDGNLPDLTGLQTIYTGDVVVPGVGWHKIDLDTSFSYNGVDNLMIWFENYDGDYTSPYPYWNGHTATYTTIYNYRDGSWPDDTGYRTSTRANIRLHFATDHDVALTEIVTPEETEGFGDIPVQVKVKNVGLNPESFDVNVEIIQTAPPLIEEDFQSAYDIRPLPPVGWLVEDTNGDGYTSGVYAYNMWGSYYSTSSSYVHSPTVSMRMEYGGSTGDNDWLFTPAVSLDAGPTYYLEWWDRMSSSSTSYDNLGEVWLCSAQNSGSILTNLWADPNMHHTTFRLDSTTFTVPALSLIHI